MPDESNDEWSISSLLPEGYIPLGYVAAVKCLDGNGDVVLLTAASSEISAWERLGMHLTAVEDVKRAINSPEGDYD